MREHLTNTQHGRCEIFCGKVHKIFVNFRVDASPLEFPRFGWTRSGRGLAGIIRAIVRHDVRGLVQSAPASVVSPCPHPVRDRDRSLSASAHSPCPRLGRKYVRELTVTVICPRSCPVRVQSVAATTRRPRCIQKSLGRVRQTVRAGLCGRLPPLISFRQPTTHAATDSVHLAFIFQTLTRII